MLYAMLAYHDEADVQSWTDAEDTALMSGLLDLHARLDREGTLGPAARLGATARARTVRGRGLVTDGPFAETKEALLGFYVLDCKTLEEAVRTAQTFKVANPGTTYEIREIALFVPGKAVPMTDAGLEAVRPKA